GADQRRAGGVYDEMMSHIDCWATLASLVGLKPSPHDSEETMARGFTSTASTTAPTSSGEPSTPPEASRFTLTARGSWECAPTLVTIPRTMTFTSRGSISPRRRTPG